MLLLLGISFWETVMVGIVAVIVFGRRLPEVAAQAVRQLMRLRKALDDLRRETGIDRELRNLRSTLDDAAREAKIENPLRLPPNPPTARTPKPAPAAPSKASAQDDPADTKSSTPDPGAERREDAG